MKTNVRELLKEKRKTIIGGISLVMFAVASFFAGKQVSSESAAEKASHQVKAPELHEGETPSKHPNTEKGRKPASQPQDSEPEDHEIEREVDPDEIQIAHRRDSTVASKSKGATKESLKETHAQAERAEDRRSAWQKLKDTYFNAVVSVHHKIVRLHQSEEENHKLRIENAHLRVMLETEKFECRVSEAKKHAEKVGSKLNAQTGTRVGRTLASIQYQIPENLLPEQLHALGVSYLKAEDHERAATILTFLTELEGDSTYKTADNFIMAGIAWYQLENLKTAEQYFTRALKDPGASDKAKTHARVWQALVSQKAKRYGDAQEWLRHTLENDPQSQEAHWVNPQNRGNRMPASQKRKKSNQGQVKKDDRSGH